MGFAKTPIRCEACGERIPSHESDLVLQDIKSLKHAEGFGAPRFFHERCSEAAYAAVAEIPGVHVLTTRSVDGDAN